MVGTIVSMEDVQVQRFQTFAQSLLREPFAERYLQDIRRSKCELVDVLDLKWSLEDDLLLSSMLQRRVFFGQLYSCEIEPT